MTISSLVTSEQLPANGVATQFSFPNKIFAATDLVVTLIDTLGNLYAFTNFANAATGLSYTVQNVDVDTGCLVVFSGPPTNGWTVDIRSATPDTQSTSIKNQGIFLPELHEEAFDRAVRQVQDLTRQAYTYGIHGPDLEKVPWTALPAAGIRAGQALLFDSNGLPTVGALPTTPLTQANIVTQMQNPFVGGASDIASITLTRNASYTGGTPGFVNSTMCLVDNVGANVAAYEWTLTAIMNNSATAGQNVAGYFQGNAQTNTTGPTWAAVCELIDNSGAASPATGRVTLELDNRAVGADASTNRVTLHLVASRPVGGGAAATIGAGILIDNNSDGANTSYQNGIILGNKNTTLCTFATGINMINGTYTSGAIWMPTGAAILFDTPGAQQLLYDSTGLQYKSGGNTASRINADGSVAYGGSLLPIKMVGTTSASATAGGTQAVPATVLGYKIEVISGVTVKVPYFSN